MRETLSLLAFCFLLIVGGWVCYQKGASDTKADTVVVQNPHTWFGQCSNEKFSERHCATIVRPPF
jgi:hypothetical protein